MMDYQMECRQEWEKKSQVKMKKKLPNQSESHFFCRVCVSVQTAKIDDLDGENVA